ncbi:HAD family hydrolase [Candidatus Symbiobacter mobilis]|uniref:HAD superfamily hydrolase n=1 Tax=Candidatus Symbiobacter mobilis CR TaxID=946483 RepID=U5N7E9_9BURK|nr:HAD family phosphatase [Candidatus Symbiobacter mobilis]AGX87235.1 HAD superfamily hydrolase [Candidatus Symbiobacter mobilis CR]
MTPCNLVLDFGSVLFAWDRVGLVREAFADLPDDRAADVARSLFDHQDWLDFDRGVLDADGVARRAVERLGVTPTAVLWLIERIGETLTPIPGTLALFEHWCARRDAGGCERVYYLSNMSTVHADALRRRFPFLQRFDGGVFSSAEHCIKPDPAIYLLLQDRYALAPADTVFVDDVQANVDAARALGWHAIHFTSAAQTQRILEEEYGCALDVPRCA